MLDSALKYECELKKLFLDTWYDEKYKFYHAMGYSDVFKITDSNWSNIELVSLDNDKNVIGYFMFKVDRHCNYVSDMYVVNFSDNKIIFGLDIFKSMESMFEKFGFDKICFCVAVGNPIEKNYDKLLEKYGGRIVGYNQNHFKLIDGKKYDKKMYEITKESYFKNQQKVDIK
jgi:hypothetical protein